METDELFKKILEIKDFELFKKSISELSDINIKNNNGETLLIYLVKNNYNIEINLKLLFNYANLNFDMVDKKGNNSVIYGIKNKLDFNIVNNMKLMCVDIKNNKNRDLIFYVCKYSDLDFFSKFYEIIEYVHNGKYQINFLITCSELKEYNAQILNKMIFLIQKGIDVNQKNEDDKTSLMICSGIFDDFINVQLVELLMKAGANVNMKYSNMSCIEILYQKYKEGLINGDIIGLYLKYGADVNTLPNDEKLFLYLSDNGYYHSKLPIFLDMISDKNTIVCIERCNICNNPNKRCIRCNYKHHICLKCKYKIGKKECEFCQPR